MKPHKKSKTFCFNLAALLCVLSSLLLPVSASCGFSNDECIDCHSKFSNKSSKQINIEEFLSSVHGEEISCLDCHQKVTDEAHTDVIGSGKVDCRTCHEGIGLHGNDATIACYVCHTRHDIQEASDARSALHCQNLKQTCGQCHPKQVKSPSGLNFLSAFQVASHPKQDFSSMQYRESNCIGCHQGAAAHGEEAPINDQDCYKCHLSIGIYAGILGYIHTSLPKNLNEKTLIAIVYSIALIFVILFLLITSRISPFQPHDSDNKINKPWGTLPPL